MSTATETPGTQIPARPLFVACGVESTGNEKSSEEDEDELPSDNQDYVYFSETNYHELTDTNDKDSPESKIDSNPLYTVVRDDSLEQADSSMDEGASWLVPVRDPVTKKIKHEVVPAEFTDETGMNIIRSVVVPIQDEDGTLSYEIKKVMVPIKQESKNRKPYRCDLCYREYTLRHNYEKHLKLHEECV